ncbi:MAG: hypothetical protein GY915_02195, partial [bacterium]|nr:hypothetical protein [bacterium]
SSSLSTVRSMIVPLFFFKALSFSFAVVLCFNFFRLVALGLGLGLGLEGKRSSSSVSGRVMIGGNGGALFTPVRVVGGNGGFFFTSVRYMVEILLELQKQC